MCTGDRDYSKRKGLPVTQDSYEGFGIDDFATNPDPRVPCVLLLDVSYSMEGGPLDQLNLGVRDYFQELQQDSIASRRVEVAIVSFGTQVKVEADFALPEAQVFTPLKANCSTSMGRAIVKGASLLEQRKREYQENGIAYYRPWLFLITDGRPTDGAEAWDKAVMTVQSGVQNKKFVFYAVGTKDADFATLRDLTSNPLQLKNIEFKQLFHWLSSSQAAISQSHQGDAVQLPPVDGWGEVPT